MWKLFKSKKQVIEENLVAEKEIIELKNEIKLINDKTYDISNKEREEAWKQTEGKNSICPKCKGKNINDRIQRQQGSLNGSIEGSSWSALTFGSSSLSGSINGKMDTNEINKCNDCNHEWKKIIIDYKLPYEVIKGKLNLIYYHLQSLYEAVNCEFDPKDLTDKYNSLTEKRNALLEDVKNSYRKEMIKSFWGGTTLKALEEIAKQKLDNYDKYKLFDKYWNEAELISLGFKEK